MDIKVSTLNAMILVLDAYCIVKFNFILTNNSGKKNNLELVRPTKTIFTKKATPT